MRCSNDKYLGKRDAEATEDAIAEVKAKIQEIGEGDSSVSSDVHVGSFFFHCLVQKLVGFYLNCRRIVDGQHYVKSNVWTFLHF